MKTYIKNLARRIPLLKRLYTLLQEPKQELKRIRDYYSFKKEVRETWQVDNGSGNGRLLVISLLGNWAEAVKQEAFLTKAIQLKKVDCFILTFRVCWANKYYRLFGINNFVYFDEYQSSARQCVQIEEVESILSSINSFNDLLQLKYGNVRIGKYIASWLMRKTHSGEIAMNDPKVRESIRHHINESLVNVIAAKQIYEVIRPNKTLFLERGYTPYGEFFDLSLEYGLDTIQWCGSHRRDAFTLKRYTSENADRHPASISKRTWGILNAVEWNGKWLEEVREELFRNYASGDWYSGVGTQFKSQIMDRDEVVKTLELDTAKKTAVVFNHLFWDATFFWGEDIFENYQEWFVETVRAACVNNNVNWIIKIHPANLVKLRRDGYAGRLVELKCIEQEIGEAPEHLKLLLPDTALSTYSLFSVMDYCVTVRGTIGIEAATFGIPVFTAGTGRYDHFGFTIDSEDRQPYLEKLLHIQKFPPLTGKQKELAEKFAFATFILRPFQLRNMKIFHQRDEVATLSVKFTPRTKYEVLDAEDLNALGEWAANSTDEDYLDKERLSWFQTGEERSSAINELESFKVR
jgi:hypothetical protein